MRTHTYLLLLILLLVNLAAGQMTEEPTPALPAPSSPEGARQPESAGAASVNDGWQVVWYPIYLFGMSAHGTVGAGGLTAPVDASFGDIISNTNFVYETALDVRKGPWGLLLDLNYLDLGASKTLGPLGLYSSASVDAKLFILDPEGYVRLLQKEWVLLDTSAGIRYWHLSHDIHFLPGILPATTVGSDDDWVDPILGARIVFNLDDAKKWTIPIKGDIGGFGTGSHFTWQVVGGVNRTFHERYRLFLGYRAFSVDRHNGPRIFDVTFNGPILGFGINF